MNNDKPDLSQPSKIESSDVVGLVEGADMKPHPKRQAFIVETAFSENSGMFHLNNTVSPLTLEAALDKNKPKTP